MRKSMATNSPMDDPAPTRAPEPTVVAKPKDNAWAKLGKDKKKYPEIDNYIQTRIAFHQQYLPGGTAITELKKSERADAWSNAVTIIKELQDINSRIQNETRIATGTNRVQI